MNYNSDPYFDRNEVSNSDLSWVKEYYFPMKIQIEKEKAYKFGTLIDAILTEPFKVDFFQYKVDGIPYTKEDFEIADQMRKSFLKDDLAQSMLKISSTQEIMIKNRAFSYGGFEFNLDVRCKWDLWINKMNYGGDIKSTAATSQKQFEEAVRFFDYDRQRAWYMDIAGSDKDVLIGISKKNFKVFKVPIRRGDDLYNEGKKKYEQLAYLWWQLFGLA